MRTFKKEIDGVVYTVDYTHETNYTGIKSYDISIYQASYKAPKEYDKSKILSIWQLKNYISVEIDMPLV